MKSIRNQLRLMMLVLVFASGGISLAGSAFLYVGYKKFQERENQKELLMAIERNFQIQVQEWKNILLRGHEPGLYQKYHRAFLDRNGSVQTFFDELKNTLPEPRLRREVERLKEEHQRIFAKYQEALGKVPDRDPKKIDKIVRGVDRPLKRILDKFHDTLTEKIEAELRSIVTGLLAMFIGMAVLAVITSFIIGIRVQKHIQYTLKAASDIVKRIGNGDLSSMDFTFQFGEIGRMLGLINKMRADFAQVILGFQESIKRTTSHAQKLEESASTLLSNSQNQAAISEEVSATVEEISASMENLSQTTEELAASLASIEQESKALKDISAKTEDAMQKLDAMARESQSYAQNAEEGIQKSRNAIQSISEQTGRISEVISIINEISEKTGLLALNASIEAARAGEAGRGFAVVAEEVSHLSERTSQSVQQIEELIQTTRSSVEQGSHDIQESTQIFQKIVERIENISESSSIVKGLSDQQAASLLRSADLTQDLVQKNRLIAESISEQKLSIQEINASVQNVSLSAGVIVENSDALKDLAKEMLEESANLKGSLEFFKLEVHS